MKKENYIKTITESETKTGRRDQCQENKERTIAFISVVSTDKLSTAGRPGQLANPGRTGQPANPGRTGQLANPNHC